MPEPFEIHKSYWEKVNKIEGGCWEWTACLNEWGYGILMVKRKKFYAHRFMLMSLGFDINNKLVIHSCDNPKCVNPDHLSLGTHQDNVTDMINKGRRVKARPIYGEASWSSKHSESVVLEAKLEYEKLPRSGPTKRVAPGEFTKLCKRFHFKKETLRQIIKGETWKNLK